MIGWSGWHERERERDGNGDGAEQREGEGWREGGEGGRVGQRDGMGRENIKGVVLIEPERVPWGG